MGIIDRTQAVLRSNFNALLSRFEEPGRDLAWLLGEMKQHVQAAQRELIRVTGERKRSDTKLAELLTEIEKWENRAELAVRHGDDGLAREALTQKQRLVAERDRLTLMRAELQQTAVGMKTEIERMQRTHQDFNARQGTIATQVSQSRAGGGAEGLGAKPGVSHFDAFERIENAIESDAAQAAAEVEVAEMLDQTALGTMTNTELDAQFQQLEAASSASDKAGIEAASAATSVDKRANPENEQGGTPRIRIEP